MLTDCSRLLFGGLLVAEDQPGHQLRRLHVQGGHHMAVRVHRDADVGVPEAFRWNDGSPFGLVSGSFKSHSSIPTGPRRWPSKPGSNAILTCKTGLCRSDTRLSTWATGRRSSDLSTQS